MNTVPLPKEVISAFRLGKTIEAIKLLRESSGLGLTEAKETVESFADQPNISLHQRSPGEVPKSRIGPWLVVILALVAVLAYLLIRRTP